MKLQFVAANSTCFNVQVCASFFLESEKGVQFLYKDSLFLGRAFINSDVVSTIACPIRRDVLLLSKTFVVLYGSFTRDALEKETIPYLEAFEFDFQNNRFLEKVQISESQFKTLMGLK